MVKVYGPYNRSDGRKHVIVYDTETQVRRTVSYPKWKYEQKLGIKLNKNQTVDHIDENFSNDKFSNFQILTRANNIRKSVVVNNRNAKYKKINCMWCGTRFKILRRVWRRSLKKNKYGIFCDKKCSGNFTRYVLNIGRGGVA